jgi:hypothetical protein
MRKSVLFFIGVLFFAACQSDSTDESVNPNAAFFYPLDTIPKVYLFRDVANGLDEFFQRIYLLKDSEGSHVIVENYSADGRITEALNYNIDSLDVLDHMVVNRNGEKTKAEVFKNQLIPFSSGQETWFATRFQGFLDSTLILKEIKRKIIGEEFDFQVLDEKVPTLKMKDRVRMTNFNPFTKQETVLEGESINYFAKGYGLIEWHTPDKKVHYRLEKIMKQEEWVKLMSR